jgi:hypothetical protein
MFTFIPDYGSTVQAREEMVGWLYARVGARPTAFSLIEWCQIAGQNEDMTPIWTSGESWFRGLLETHSLTPLLTLVPSMDSGRTWIGAAVALLDAASFALSSLNVKGLESKRLCHAMGVNPLCLARELPGAMSGHTATSENIDDIAAEYDAARARFVAWGDHHIDFLKMFAPFHNGIPCERWLRTLVNRVDPRTFGHGPAEVMIRNHRDTPPHPFMSSPQ